MWTDDDIQQMRAALLDWYDREGRTLPWRVRPEDRAKGIRPNPYAVWLSEIMLQQTTIPHGTPYWFKFLELYPTVHDLASAPLDDVLTHWAGLGYYARARNLHKCANVIVSDHGGEFPQTKAELIKLPGIGDYTASTIAAICFDEPTSIVDGNVERVVARMCRVETPLPKAKSEIKRLAAMLADPERPGDYGQALMDLGATICTPKGPAHLNCVWRRWCEGCAYGDAERFPIKAPRKAQPVRYGHAYIMTRGDQVLLRKRPEEGLLGGMMEVPTSDWVAEWPDFEPPIDSQWNEKVGQVEHVFTHFKLKLRVHATECDQSARPNGNWVRIHELNTQAIPSLMRKVLAFLPQS